MSYSSEVLADSPSLWLRLGEASGTAAADSSGNGHGGTYTTTYILSQAGALVGDADTAVKFTGGRVTVTNAAWMNATTFTSECWVKPGSGGGSITVAGWAFARHFGNTVATNKGWYIANSGGAAGKWTGFARIGGVDYTVTGTTTTSSSRYDHVVLVYDGSALILYVNGAVEATTPATGTPQNPTHDIKVGGATSGQTFNDGTVDEAAHWVNIALSAGRVQRHYQEGTGTYVPPPAPTVTPTVVGPAPQRSPLVPWLTSIDGSQRLPLFSIGPTGSWGDLSFSTRWGEGASGMFEASWSMPLPPDFTHPLLRRGTLVELQDGPWRIGSPLILSEPAVGTGYSDPWQFTATGIGREVEGENSFYCFRVSDGETTAIPSEAVDYARTVDGWRIAGRHANVPTGAIGGTSTTDELMTVGSLLNAVNDLFGTRWAVNGDNILQFYADPTTPTYQVVPGAAALGTSDDDYATVVKFRYKDSSTGTFKTVSSPSTASAVEQRFGRRTYGVNRTAMAAMTSSVAQAFADGILAATRGRLAWTNGLTLTSNEILTMGGVPADLSKVAEDVASGCMVRLHGIWNDLLEYNGQTWLDIIIGEAKLTDGAQTIDLSPLGLAPRDLAAIVETLTGYKDAA